MRNLPHARDMSLLACVSGIRLIIESRTLVAGDVELPLMALGLAVPLILVELHPVLGMVAGTALRNARRHRSPYAWP